MLISQAFYRMQIQAGHIQALWFEFEEPHKHVHEQHHEDLYNQNNQQQFNAFLHCLLMLTHN